MRSIFQAVGARETSGDHGDYDYGRRFLAGTSGLSGSVIPACPINHLIDQRLGNYTS